jgi:hypothetical protein
MALVDWMWNRTAAIASPIVFLGLFVLCLIFIFVLFPITKRHFKEIETFDANPWGFSAGEAPTIMSKFSGEQLRHYLNQERFTDLAFPIVYGIGFAVAMVLLVNFTGAPRWLVLLPYIAALADWCENASVICMIGRHQKGQPLGVFAQVGSIASRLKHGFLAATVIVLIGLGAWALWGRFKR